MKDKGTPMQTAPLDFRLATRADEELLIALMREFYAEDRSTSMTRACVAAWTRCWPIRAMAKCCCGWTRRARWSATR